MTDNLSFINWGFKPTTTTKPEDKDYWLIIGFHIVEDPACLTYWIYSKEDYPIIDDASLSEILEDFYGCEVEVDGRYFHLWAGENAWRLTSYKGITLEQKEFLNSCSIF